MSFRTFDLAHDVASIISAVNEVVTLSSSLYASPGGDQNVKTYSNISSTSASLGGYWQTVFDSAPTSLQSTALFDVTFGFSTASSYYQGTTVEVSGCANEKVKIYQEMASLLLGRYNQQFQVGGQVANECFFVLVKRGIMKDELKKGVVSVILSGSYSGFMTASDLGASANYRQTLGGDYAPLFSGSTTGSSAEVGQVWYNAGVVVIPAINVNLPWLTGTLPVLSASGNWSGSSPNVSSLTGALTASTIDNLVSGFRSRMTKLNFQNQTNLYSTVYFCRATNTEFNYSSNPTFIDDNQRIRVTSGSNVLQSRTYITKIGLYDANDNLLAVGSVNKPITKSPDTESIFRIRLDY